MDTALYLSKILPPHPPLPQIPPAHPPPPSGRGILLPSVLCSFDQVAPIKEHLSKACPHGNDLILDSEVRLHSLVRRLDDDDDLRRNSMNLFNLRENSLRTLFWRISFRRTHRLTELLAMPSGVAMPSDVPIYTILVKAKTYGAQLDPFDGPRVPLEVVHPFHCPEFFSSLFHFFSLPAAGR